jgi:hypothetical protein
MKKQSLFSIAPHCWRALRLRRPGARKQLQTPRKRNGRYMNR